jgi:hypothetical protein
MQPIVHITARSADLGDGLLVRRALPSRRQRMIGAWCFLDHAGPLVFAPGAGMHIGAHPHTGLQTFTWVLEGEVLHRDSLGNEQIIRPGQVNLMTAGRGVAHTEDSLNPGQCLNLAQLWIALPEDHQDCAPDFAHYPQLPHWQSGGASFTLLAGSFAGQVAPTKLYSPLLGLDIASDDGAELELALNPRFEYGLLTLSGEARIDGETGLQGVAARRRAVRSAGTDVVELRRLQSRSHRPGPARLGKRRSAFRPGRRRQRSTPGATTPAVARLALSQSTPCVRLPSHLWPWNWPEA